MEMLPKCLKGVPVMFLTWGFKETVLSRIKPWLVTCAWTVTENNNESTEGVMGFVYGASGTNRINLSFAVIELH